MSLRARTSQWSLRRRVAIAFVGVGALLIALSLVVGISVSRFEASGDAVVTRWQPAQGRAQDLVADALDQDNAIRGYILRHSADTYTQYQQAVTAEAADSTALRRLIGSSAAESHRVDAFTVATAAWRAAVADPVHRAVLANPNADYRDLIANLPGPTLQAAIRRAGVALQSDLATRSSRAVHARTEDRRVFEVTLLVAIVLIALACIAVWRAMHNWVLRPVDRLAEQARSVVATDMSARIVATGPAEFLALGADVETMHRRAVDALAEVEAGRLELARSNADLEQFAYVASHDLSEPLRKIANFCQLLERQYGPELDDRAREYLGFAVDGAKRMQQLITDLLELSRVGRQADRFQAVAMTDVVERATSTLQTVLRTRGGRVEAGPLPVVRGDPVLLTSLLQNLIGNAAKYRRPDEAPVVRISSDMSDGVTVFTVADNGIGVPDKYAERIFQVFQRLHLREEYEGTGIGLALCRRIVEFHGGRIWLDTSAPPPGATFRFTLGEGATRDRRA